MSSPTPPAPERALGRMLRSLSPAERRAFLVDLYAARGYAVERVDGGLVATDPPERVVVAVPGCDAPGSIVEPDLVLAVGDGSEALDPAGWSSAGARLLDPARVREALLYAVDRAEADELCRTHFDRPLGAIQNTARPLRFGVPDWLTAGRASTLLALAVVVVGVLALLGPANPVDTVGSTGPTVAGPVAGTGTDAGDPTPTDEGPTAEGRSTPSPVPAGARGASLAPGLSTNGVTDVDELAAAHADWLADRSYRWELRYAEFRDGNRTAVVNETVVVAGPNVYRTTATQAGAFRTPMPLETTQAFANGTYRWVWTGGLDRFSFRRSLARTEDGRGRQVRRAASQIRRFLDPKVSVVAGSTAGQEEVRFLVSGGGTSRPRLENYTVSAMVDRNGVVRELQVSYEVPAEDVTVVYGFRYEALGETTVEPPEWFPVARNATAGGR